MDKYINYIKGKYQKQADKWGSEAYRDDRKLYCNMYGMIIEALEFLTDETPILIKSALIEKIDENAKVLDRILKKFSEM